MMDCAGPVNILNQSGSERAETGVDLPLMISAYKLSTVNKCKKGGSNVETFYNACMHKLGRDFVTC